MLLRAPMFFFEKKNMGVSEGLWKTAWLLMLFKMLHLF